jgi:hypothetical protein
MTIANFIKQPLFLSEYIKIQPLFLDWNKLSCLGEGKKNLSITDMISLMKTNFDGEK